MSDFYEELLQDFEEIIAMEKGLVPMEEIPNMLVKTYAPKLEKANG